MDKESNKMRMLYEGQTKSLYEICKEINAPVSMMYEIVSQKRKLKNIRVDTAIKIAKNEGMTVEELVEKAKKIGIE